MRLVARGRREKRPIRLTGWAFRLWGSKWGESVWWKGPLRGLAGVALFACLLLFAAPLLAQHGEDDQAPAHEASTSGHVHHDGSGGLARWEGSPEGVAYSEFNHHLAGLFILVIGLSEWYQILALPLWGWPRLLLPGALLGAGFFLLIWSDHEAWPIGSLSFTQTFFGDDLETVQHKTYALLALTVGAIELWRRLRRIAQAAWAMPLPLFAIIGGLLLFWHSHGTHPSAHKIASHHTIMGALAMTAGSTRLVSEWRRRQGAKEGRYWDIAWAGLILLIGAQLLFYSE